MTRPDVKKKHLKDFFDWSYTLIGQTSEESLKDVMVLDGVLQALVINTG